MRLLIVTQKIDKNDQILGFFHSWVREFAGHTDVLTVICLEKGEYDLPGVRVISLGKENGASRLGYIISFYRAIWQYRNDYDSVFVHMNPEYVVLGGLFWRLLRKKISLWYMHKSVDLKLRVAEKLTHIIFTGSKDSFRLKSGKVRVTGHGIDISQFPFQEKRSVRPLCLLYVGRISRIKNLGMSIEVLEKLIREGIDARLDVVGGAVTFDDESYFDSIYLDIEKKPSIVKNITFHGVVSHCNLMEYYQGADVLVHFSQTGSLDKVVLEAILSGLCVLSSNDSSIDLFGKHKDLFGISNNAQSAYNKIQSYIGGDLEKYTEAKKEMRAIVERDHSLSHLVADILDILS